jgi:NAD(P)-dependent dehydrogenase (short-subunit alcohol dehydrogenase family)
MEGFPVADTAQATGRPARFIDRVAVITGASSGIGREAARMIHAEGGYVLLSDIHDPEWLPDDDRAAFVEADVRDPAQVQRMIDEAVARFGRLDVLFNNAGTPGRLPRPETAELPIADWDDTLDINLKGTFLCSKAAIPHLRAAGGGAIVNNASMLGIVGLPESAAYCASKGGAVLLTKSMALELIEDGIRVNCLCASFIDTKMFNDWLDLQDDADAARTQAMAQLPIGRLGTAEEVARAAVFLASDEASYIVGHALYVDGGYLAK